MCALCYENRDAFGPTTLKPRIGRPTHRTYTILGGTFSALVKDRRPIPRMFSILGGAVSSLATDKRPTRRGFTLFGGSLDALVTEKRPTHRTTPQKVELTAET